jgi:hypothetical protein
MSSFAYRTRKPFPPKRLFNLIHDKFVTFQNVDQVDDETDGHDEDTHEVMANSEGTANDYEPLGIPDTEVEGDELADKEFQKGIPPEVSDVRSLSSNRSFCTGDS